MDLAALSELPTVSFAVIAAFLTVYALLDGYDLGVGMLHVTLARTDRERRVLLQAIGPAWDGNEVWLLAGAGALFAAFPRAFWTLFEGFRAAFVVILFGLVLRASSKALRSRREDPLWRGAWDACFAAGSASLLFGLALASLLRGLPLSSKGEPEGPFLAPLDPFALLLGALTVSVFLLHGTAWLVRRTEGELQVRVRRAALGSWLAFLALWVAVLPVAYAAVPGIFVPFGSPLAFAIPTLLHLALMAFPIALVRGVVPPAAFSSAVIVGLAGSVAVGLYPNLAPALGEAGGSLTVWNAASAPGTLCVLLAVAALGVPIALALTVSRHRPVRGPVAPPEEAC